MKTDKEKLEDELLDLSGRHELNDKETERVNEIQERLKELEK